MISDIRCHECFIQAFEKLLLKERASTEQACSFKEKMNTLIQELGTKVTAPELSRELHRSLKEVMNIDDPYLMIKKKTNDQVLFMYEELQNKIATSTDPFDTAMRLAIAGNIIDCGVPNEFNINQTIDHVLQSPIAIDHSTRLKEQLNEANSILYIGDNSGEIVCDKLFIETLGKPNVTYAVRGSSILNDATLEDAEYVGMPEVARVISNGDDAPSTILQNCSSTFRYEFYNADVIISKGQGNFEGLYRKTGKNIFYLLMVKCDVIAEQLKVRKGDFIVKSTY